MLCRFITWEADSLTCISCKHKIFILLRDLRGSPNIFHCNNKIIVMEYALDPIIAQTKLPKLKSQKEDFAKGKQQRKPTKKKLQF